MEAPAATLALQPVFREITCGVCGYLRTGLAPNAKCPECGAPPAKRVAPLTRSAGAAADQSEQAWLFSLTVGLLLLIVCTYFALQSELFVSNGGLALVTINAPGPKLTAGSCLLREMGPPAEWGVQGVIATMGTLLAVWLITEPRAQRLDEHALSLRRCLRATAVVTFGGLLGGLLSGYEIDIRFWGWYGLPSTLAAVGLVELPCNTLLYLYLASISRRFDPAAEPRPQRALVAATWLVAISCGSGVVLSVLRAAAQDRPVETWRIIQVVYGMLTITAGLTMTMGTLRLTANVSAAMFDRSVLSLAESLQQWLGPLARFIGRLRAMPDRTAAAAGLLLWMIGTRPLITFTATFEHRLGYGGDLPTLNFIGPKFWAIPLLDVGREGRVDTRLAVFSTLAALWLITLYRPPHVGRWTTIITRWVPTLLLGAGLGFTLVVERALDDFRQSYWNAGAAFLIEAPATFLAYRYLANIAAAIGHATLTRQLRTLAYAAAALILWPISYLALSKQLHALNHHASMLLSGVVYGILMVTAGMMVWASFVRLAWLLIAPGNQRSADATCSPCIAATNSGVGAT